MKYLSFFLNQNSRAILFTYFFFVAYDWRIDFSDILVGRKETIYLNHL